MNPGRFTGWPPPATHQRTADDPQGTWSLLAEPARGAPPRMIQPRIAQRSTASRTGEQQELRLGLRPVRELHALGEGGVIAVDLER
jgi:hypothetical protein